MPTSTGFGPGLPFGLGGVAVVGGEEGDVERIVALGAPVARPVEVAGLAPGGAGGMPCAGAGAAGWAGGVVSAGAGDELGGASG